MLLKIFKRKPKYLLDPDTTQWLFDTYAWALKNFGSDIFYEDTLLVTPTDKHFPDKISNTDEMATKVFNRVKIFAGMEKWECDLKAQEPDNNPVVSPTIVIQNAPQNPAGTFSIEENEKPIITYNPNQVNHPETLIATYAHELAHYLSNMSEEAPPNGEDLWEPATDLLAVFMGFGLFLSNTAFSFQQHTDIDSQGWATQQQGYLSQFELAYALAIFCLLKEIPYSTVQKYLKKSLQSFYKKAIKEIEKNENELNKLRKIKSLKKES